MQEKRRYIKGVARMAEGKLKMMTHGPRGTGCPFEEDILHASHYNYFVAPNFCSHTVLSTFDKIQTCVQYTCQVPRHSMQWSTGLNRKAGTQTPQALHMEHVTEMGGSREGTTFSTILVYEEGVGI